ncbi:IS5 family transposase [Bradyrhizobium sp. AZCC 2289]|uniref:IS5 family transposase n=1 Tax=Bradyrhizobium sp. AZCC 2289 TaxID=3117026 RepID=UPI002FEF1823
MHGYFDLWTWDGTLDRIHHALYVQCREVGQPRTQPERRHHRQSKRQERGKRGAWIDPHGYDAGKKIKGKKRHILVDTQGLLLHALVHSADIQDRDGGVLVMATLFGLHPFLLKLYADGGYQGPIFQSAVRKILRQIDVEIVKRSDTAKGFAVLPKRWIVERTIAWLNRCRRLAKDWECLNRKALAFLRLASIRLMLRKLCQKTA